MKHYECFIRHHLPSIEVNADNIETAQMLVVKELCKRYKESDFENLDIKVVQKGAGFFKRFWDANF